MKKVQSIFYTIQKSTLIPYHHNILYYVYKTSFQWRFKSKEKNFPITYKTECILCILNYQGGGQTSNAYYGLWQVISVSNSGFNCNGNGAAQNIYALGY